jgi:hypothetical protein
VGACIQVWLLLMKSLTVPRLMSLRCIEVFIRPIERNMTFWGSMEGKNTHIFLVASDHCTCQKFTTGAPPS